jgi:dTDP-4-amino-4,6-dideoxygalactose transaminase
MTFLGRVALYQGLLSQKLEGATILVPNYHEGVEIDTLLAADCQLVYYRVTKDLRVDLADVACRLQGAKVLYVIHYFGFPQPMDEIVAFCKKHNLKLIEDCALSLFSGDTDGWLGRYGDIAIFSIHKTCPIPGFGFLLSNKPAKLDSQVTVSAKITFIQSANLFRRSIRASSMAGVERGLTALRRWISRTTSVDIHDDLNLGQGQWDPCMSQLTPSRWAQYFMRFINPNRVIAKRRENFELLANALRGYVNLPFDRLPDGVCPLFLPILVEHKLDVQKRLRELGVESISFWSRIHSSCPLDLGNELSLWRKRCLALGVHQNLNRQTIIQQSIAVRRAVKEFTNGNQAGSTVRN